MADPALGTAEAQLGRILYILAAARGDHGRPVAELAARLGVTLATIRDDVAQVTGREFYHPAASVMEMTILLERERISVPLAGEFRRPMRLTPREAGALGLALRARAAESAPPERAPLLELALALEKALTAPEPRTLGTAGARGSGGGPGSKRPSLATAVAIAPIAPGAGAAPGMRLLLQEALSRHKPVSLLYLKPGAARPTPRTAHPYALVTAGGEWYVVGFSPESRGVRKFRLDRILSAELAEGSFAVPPDFDLAQHVEAGRAYQAVEEVETVVRYSAHVAPWVVEQWGGERREDGSVVVRHRVADPRWLARLVLGFAGEAVVEGPPEMRAAVADAARRIAGACA